MRVTNKKIEDMFKELGEFIDHVGKATGRMIEQILSDKEKGNLLGVLSDTERMPQVEIVDIDVDKIDADDDEIAIDMNQ